MKGFKKLILATAIIAASSSTFAMQAMDDESLSSTTGQDGITITSSTNLQGLNIQWVDRNGAGAGFTGAGAVLINGVGIDTSSVVTIDAGGDTGTGAGKGQLRIGVTMGATTINLSNTTINVADAPAAGAASLVGSTNIITFGAGAALNISAGGTLDLRLGNRNVGDHMISMVSDLASVSLTGLTINDTGLNGGGGSIGVGKIVLGVVHSAANIDVVAGGLQIDTTGTTIGSIGLENVQLGTVDLSTRNNTIGDVYVTGNGVGGAIAMSSTITITGH